MPIRGLLPKCGSLVNRSLINFSIPGYGASEISSTLYNKSGFEYPLLIHFISHAIL